MFAQALNVTLRILVLRAGPQDFPFGAGLTPVLVLLAAAANTAVFSRVLPLPMALGIALAMVLAMAVVTRSILRARKLDNRFAQTFDALMATGAVLTLALLPPFAQIAPQLLDLAKHPEALADPEKVQMPGLPVFVMNLLNFWSFAVTAHIFRHAANVQLWVGLFIAFLAAGVSLFIGIIGGTFAGALFGANLGG
ncbi:MAG: hypothetical protein E6R07_07585 [Nevskiaceae bacterium]|nr:MAG: hypothetical protein E6R07_07585 [Nevskiaceae bacterium]